jgi:hypothetical protein
MNYDIRLVGYIASKVRAIFYTLVGSDEKENVR